MFGGSITVKAETVEDEDGDEEGEEEEEEAEEEEEEDDDDLSPSYRIVKGRAISVWFGHNRESASANSLSDLLTKCTVKSSSCIAMNHRATIEVGFCFV